MSLNKVPSGKNLPDDFNVVIEISMHSEPIKYEVDKESRTPFLVMATQWMCWLFRNLPCPLGWLFVAALLACSK